jgi:hypothetical protein
MHRTVLLVIFGLVLFGCTQTKEIIFDESTTLAENEMYAWWFEANADDRIYIDMNITEGGPVDVYITDSVGYADYSYNLEGGVKDFIVEDQELGVLHYSNDIKIIQPGKYYVIVDNTAATQGTDPDGDVKIKIIIIRN